MKKVAIYLFTVIGLLVLGGSIHDALLFFIVPSDKKISSAAVDGMFQSKVYFITALVLSGLMVLTVGLFAKKLKFLVRWSITLLPFILVFCLLTVQKSIMIKQYIEASNDVSNEPLLITIEGLYLYTIPGYSLIAMGVVVLIAWGILKK